MLRDMVARWNVQTRITAEEVQHMPDHFRGHV
jgi:hypothetical protein